MLRNILILFLFSFITLGCQPGVQLDRPPDVRLGEDTCDECRMIISEARFSATYVTRQGETRRFDDIGDMFLFYTKHTEDVATFWVHDYETDDWLKADQAFFVVSPSLHTPMGHGIVAVGSKSRAEALAAEVQGTILTFNEVLAKYKAGEMGSEHSPQHKMDMDNMEKGNMEMEKGEDHN